MDTSEMGVLVGGMALIGFILWYFFGEGPKTEAIMTETGKERSK